MRTLVLAALVRFYLKQSSLPLLQEQGGCGALNLVQGAVRAPPRCLAVALAWGPAPPSDADLAAVISALPPRLDARAAFPGACWGVCVVCEGS